MPTSKRTRPGQHLTIGNLSDAQRDHLRAIGGGNLTEGIRRLLDQAQENPKWEYWIVWIDLNTKSQGTALLNESGAEGWELVSVGPWEGDRAWATFKRRIVTPDAREAKENEHGEAR